MASTDDLLAAALELPADERARFAHELLRSLDDGKDDDGAAEAWTAEIRRRLQEVQDGSVELIEWDDLRATIAKRRAARRADR